MSQVSHGNRAIRLQTHIVGFNFIRWFVLRTSSILIANFLSRLCAQRQGWFTRPRQFTSLHHMHLDWRKVTLCVNVVHALSRRVHTVLTVVACDFLCRQCIRWADLGWSWELCEDISRQTTSALHRTGGRQQSASASNFESTVSVGARSAPSQL